jgi:hypothetical protein
MTNDDVEQSLRASEWRLTELRAAIDAGVPWPLSERFDHAPEATWGPPELLAHLVEMIPYWQAELARVAAGSPDGTPVPFGRIATDADRLANIERLRQESIEHLYRAFEEALDGFITTWAGWSAEDRQRLGVHPVRGEQTVAAEIQRTLVGHLSDHVDQLEGVIGTRADP